MHLETARISYPKRNFPDPAERLLLRAACLAPDIALAAWKEWRGPRDLSASLRTSVDLFPAIYRNLGPLLGPDEGILGGMYRRTWVHNQMLFAQAGRIVRLLDRSGIPALVLKGAALASTVYRDTGARPMFDVDLLVPLPSAEAALDLLTKDGWKPEVPPGGSMSHIVQVVRSVDLIGRDGSRIDLHWHVLADECDPGDDDDFWSGSVTASLLGIEARTLGVTDQLLHSIYHGHKWSANRSILWLMDAFKILEEAGTAVSWPLLVRSAGRTSVVLPVLATLRYLRSELGAPVPAEVIQELSGIKTGVLDRLNYRSQDSDDDLRGVLQRELFGYLKKSQGRPPLARLRGWSWYLQAAWGVSHPLLLIPKIALRVYDRLRQASSNNSAEPLPLPEKGVQG